MAYATELTISTGNKVSLNYQTQDVSVSVTYQLEREDGDVVAVVKEKTVELAQAHRTAWQTLRDAKVAAAKARQELSESSLGPIPKVVEVSATANDELVSEATESPPETATIEPIRKEASLEPRITPGQVAAIALLLRQAGWSDERRTGYLQECFSCDSVDELSSAQARQWLLELQRAERNAIQQRRLENAHHNGKH